MLTTWDYFSAHYRREYGKEPDMDNQNHVLLASWFVVGASDQAFIRSRVSEPDRSRMSCDCKDSAIRRVDAKRTHPAIEREGWFCMGCLTEFIQHNAQGEAQPPVKKTMNTPEDSTGGCCPPQPCSADPFPKWKWMMDYCRERRWPPSDFWDLAEKAWCEKFEPNDQV